MGVPFGLADKIRGMKKTEKKKSYFIYVHLLLNSARPVASFASQYRGESGVVFPKCLVSNQLRTPRGGVGELGSEFGDEPATANRLAQAPVFFINARRACTAVESFPSISTVDVQLTHPSVTDTPYWSCWSIVWPGGADFGIF